ncbi:hypothetical protein EVAR_8597_1 [Eumeta japonica]|uniref:Histone-lysine N-methyltransferase SETMAR n=1 Tax=Eumeta variegata TaxID=151549 RepID=A0A4C1XEB4_EUMVA|nr:hypothetical protein EVAR_8597_1 [Eumeta japonica]
MEYSQGPDLVKRVSVKRKKYLENEHWRAIAVLYYDFKRFNNVAPSRATVLQRLREFRNERNSLHDEEYKACSTFTPDNIPRVHKMMKNDNRFRILLGLHPQRIENGHGGLVHKTLLVKSSPDDASSHTAALTVNFLKENNITVLENPPYSLDLAIYSYLEFFNLKKIEYFVCGKFVYRSVLALKKTILNTPRKSDKRQLTDAGREGDVRETSNRLACGRIGDTLLTRRRVKTKLRIKESRLIIIATDRQPPESRKVITATHGQSKTQKRYRYVANLLGRNCISNGGGRTKGGFVEGCVVMEGRMGHGGMTLLSGSAMSLAALMLSSVVAIEKRPSRRCNTIVRVSLKDERFHEGIGCYEDIDNESEVGFAEIRKERLNRRKEQDKKRNRRQGLKKRRWRHEMETKNRQEEKKKRFIIK